MHLKNKHADRLAEWAEMQERKRMEEQKEPEAEEAVPVEQQLAQVLNAPRAITEAELFNRFAYHQPGSQDVIEAHGSTRLACLELARKVVSSCPPSRETSLAVTAIEDAMMWANAAIARHHPDNQKVTAPQIPEGT